MNPIYRSKAYMKKLPIKILTITICLLCLMATHQETSAQLRYGFRVGGDFATSSLSDVSDYSLVNRSGFSGGLMLEYQAPKCGFAADIAFLYAGHNTRLRFMEEEPRSFGRNFIDLPIHLKYKFWLTSTHSLFAPMIYTGPVFSFRLDHNDAKPLATKTIQPGWDVGVGFDIINFIEITGGYRFGLGNAIKNFETYPDAYLHSNGWNISVNIIFDF